jgi:DTW domain-containing protein YfiP
MHHSEAWRPSSTGHLIQRVFPESRQFRFHHDAPIDPATVRLPGKELWVLHPLGETLPTDRPPEEIQVLLLDGTWAQARDMMRATEGWGRRVRLPLSGKSRYWLRSQQSDAGRFSTVEALLSLIQSLGLRETHTALQLQFELHVYAGLRARGRRIEAETYLADSPVLAAFPEVIHALDHPLRPNA